MSRALVEDCPVRQMRHLIGGRFARLYAKTFNKFFAILLIVMNRPAVRTKLDVVPVWRVRQKCRWAAAGYSGCIPRVRGIVPALKSVISASS